MQCQPFYKDTKISLKFLSTLQKELLVYFLFFFFRFELLHHQHFTNDTYHQVIQKADVVHDLNFYVSIDTYDRYNALLKHTNLKHRINCFNCFL